MYIIFEMIHYFGNSTIDNQIGRSNKHARKDELKQTIKEINIGNQVISHNIANQMAPHKKSFAGNQSVVKSGIKKRQNARNFLYSRFLLCFYSFAGTKIVFKAFIFCKQGIDKPAGGKERGRGKR